MPLIKPEFNRIARFAPLIGLLIGLSQSIIWLLLSNNGWPRESLVLIVLGIGGLATGGIHLDGLIDTADGIAAGKEKCLEAMRDSRVGSIGIQVFLLVIFLQIAALIKLGNSALFVIPIAAFWGRVSPLWAIEKFPYLHSHGLSKFHKKNWKGYLKEIKPSLLILILISSFLIFNSMEIEKAYSILICLVSGIIPAIIIPHLLGKMIGGHSGDSYGASVVVVETFILLFTAIIL